MGYKSILRRFLRFQKNSSIKFHFFIILQGVPLNIPKGINKKRMYIAFKYTMNHFSVIIYFIIISDQIFSLFIFTLSDRYSYTQHSRYNRIYPVDILPQSTLDMYTYTQHFRYNRIYPVDILANSTLELYTYTHHPRYNRIYPIDILTQSTLEIYTYTQHSMQI